MAYIAGRIWDGWLVRWKLVQSVECGPETIDLVLDLFGVFGTARSLISGDFKVAFQNSDGQPVFMLFGMAPRLFLVQRRNTWTHDRLALNHANGFVVGPGLHVDAFQVVEHPEQDVVLADRGQKIVGPCQASAGHAIDQITAVRY